MCGAIDHFTELNDFKKRLEEQLGRIPPNHYMRKQYEKEIAKSQATIVRYYVLLTDEKLIHPTVRVLDLLL